MEAWIREFESKQALGPWRRRRPPSSYEHNRCPERPTPVQQLTCSHVLHTVSELEQQDSEQKHSELKAHFPLQLRLRSDLSLHLIANECKTLRATLKWITFNTKQVL